MAYKIVAKKYKYNLLQMIFRENKKSYSEYIKLSYEIEQDIIVEYICEQAACLYLGEYPASEGVPEKDHHRYKEHPDKDQ